MASMKLMRLKSGQARNVALGTCVLGVALMLPAVHAAAQAPKGPQVRAPGPTFTKDIAPIFQEKCEACHRPARWRRCRS